MNQVFFDKVASYGDWGIYLSSLDIGDAPIKENYIDIPSGDGSIDLTEALTGEVSYGNRPFEAVFTIKPPRSNWNHIKRTIRSFLNGRKRIIRSSEDGEYYLIGRCTTSFEIDGAVCMLTVKATCEPYIYKNSVTIHDLTIGATGSITFSCKNSRKRVIPRITVSSNVIIEFNNMSIAVNSGTFRYTNIVFVEGYNELKVTGAVGTRIKIEYEEGII